METVSEKQCFKCDETKPLSEFYKHPQMADGHLNKCKACTKAEANKHREDNLARIQKADRDRYAADPEPKKQNAHRYRLENKEKCDARSQQWNKNNREARRVISTRWRRNNPGYISRYEKERKTRDPMFAMMKRLRVRLHHAIRAAGTKKADNTVELIGCSPRKLCEHLEQQFLPGMSWENRDLWHIDHKRPVSSFDLSNPEHQRVCFNWSNLQPLWAEQNLDKGDKYDQD